MYMKESKPRKNTNAPTSDTRRKGTAKYTAGNSQNQGRRQKALQANEKKPELPVKHVKNKADDRDRNIVRVRTPPDRIMITIILTLLCLGTVMVFSASYPEALTQKGDSLYYIKRQMMFVFGGLILMAIATIMPYKFYKKITPLIYIITIVLLVVVFFYGVAEGEAQRWIKIPGVSFTIQPSEIMKLALVLMLAWHIENHRDDINNISNGKKSFFHGVLVPGMYILFAAGLVLIEKHLSGTLIIAAIGMVVVFIGTSRPIAAIGTYAAGAGAAAAVFLMTNSYALKRITTFTNENADALNENWQTSQGLLAIGSGGFLGVGLGNSRQKYSYVSQPQNDFIFTIWCEEMGFVGAVFVIALYLLFIWRGYIIAMRAPDTYSSLVAFGITSKVGIQALLNIGVVTDVIPNTGVALPFFSYGGSFLLILLTEMGILLSISKHSYQKQ